MNFVIAAGGTGGHLFPGLAVGEVLLQRGHAVMLIISEKEIDSLATQGAANFASSACLAWDSKQSPLALFKFILRFKAGLNQVKGLYRDFQPSAVLAWWIHFDGAILAGRSRKIPTFVHESNPSRQSEQIERPARHARAARLRGCAAHFRRAKDRHGHAHSHLFGHAARKAQRSAAFGLAPGPRTLLVMGGSQGAHGITRR